jgi:hypothetical protein
VEELLKSGKAFSASEHWSMCSSRISNAGATLMAQKRQIAMNKEARLKIAEKKMQANNKILQKAQQALEKYQANENSWNDKDWGMLSNGCSPKQRCNFS